MRALRVGIIGLGVGAHHAEACWRHPDVQLTWLCDMDSELGESYRVRYPGVRFTSHADELLTAADVDLVVIASYDNDHFNQTMTAIRHGKHVFVEKPLCLHEYEAFCIRRLLDEHPGLRLSSNLILRKSPRFLYLRTQIRKGDLGEVYCAEGDYLYGRPERLTSGWRADQLYYSLVFGGAVHLVDLMMWLLDDTVIEVSAMSNKMVTQDTAFRFDDCFVALLRFSKGAVGKVSVHGACMHPHFHGLTVYGSKATFINTKGQARILTSRNPSIPEINLDTPYPGYEKGALLMDFIDAILRKRPGPVSEMDVFKTMAVCFAIERAAKERRSIQVRSI